MNSFRCAAAATLVLCCLAPGNLLCATGRAECQSVSSKILGHVVPYCVLLPPSYDSERAQRFPVLYLLHGLGDDEQMLIHSGGFNLIEDLWERHQIGDFLIVTPAGGASFYINSRDRRNLYEDFFLQEFVGQIEERYRAKPDRAFRAIAGISMGGYGALHLAFRHPELFGSVGAHSAALIERLPAVTGTDSPQRARSNIFASVFGSPLDPAFWKKNDPLNLARTANLVGLQIYFNCGSEDDFGFESGAADLDKILTSRHVPHEFHLYRGGHNWVYFAEHLPALLKFHSNIFDKSASRHP